MGQLNRGTKRRCGQCGANFYDLDHVPVVCPKCHAAYVAGPALPVHAVAHVAHAAHTAPRPAPLPHAAADDEDDALAGDDADDGLSDAGDPLS